MVDRLRGQDNIYQYSWNIYKFNVMKKIVLFIMLLFVFNLNAQNDFLLKSYERPIIEVNVNGKEVFMLIDTGSSLNVVDFSQLEDLEIKRRFKIGDVMCIAGGSGLISSVFGSEGLGGSYLDSDYTNTFNAYTINLINSNLTSALGRIGALETSTPNVAWGTATSQYSPLTINSVTRNLSLDGHTHSYLPLSGGTLSGDLRVNARIFINSDSHHLFYNSAIGCISSKYGFAVGDNYVWHAGNFTPSSYLPLTGGTLSGNLSVGDVGLDRALLVRNISSYDSGPLGLNPWGGNVTINGNTAWHAGNDGAGSGLDADLFGGLHNTSFLRCDSINADDPKNGHYAIGTDSTHNFIQSHAGKPLYLNELGNAVYINNVLAATINSNVASATKLANTRTIWGQSFDGTGNVDGLFRNVYGDTGEAIIHKTLTYPTSPYGLFTRAYGDGSIDLQPQRESNDSERFNLTLCRSGGNVGVGIIPSYKLDVNGTFRAIGAGYFNSSLTVTGLLSGSNESMSGYSTANRFYAGYDSGIDNSISCSNWFRSNGESGWFNDSKGAGIYSDTANIVRTYGTNKFKVYNAESDSIYTLGGLKADQNSTLRGITLTNGTKSKDFAIGSNGAVQIGGVVSANTYTLPATIGWYRVAMSPSGIERCSGQFDIDWTISSYHGSVSLNAGTMFGSGAYLSQSGYTYYGTSITKSRIVYHTSYAGNYAYLEVYNSAAQAVSLTVRGYNLLGWTLYSASTAGSIPSGYSNKELTHSSGYVTSGNIYALGEVTAYSASDIRLKKNINYITSALSTLDKLNPVTYNWNNTAKELNNTKTDTLEYGLIAQELEDILPELVHPLYSNYKAIDYIKLIPLLIKGIQELNKKIKDHGID